MEKHKIRDYLFLIVLLLASLGLVIFCLVHNIQYNNLTKGMVEHVATVTDIQTNYSPKHSHVQNVSITYEVSGTVYTRELATDTTISFAAGTNADMRVGDTVRIFYNPNDPYEIAAPQTTKVGTAVLVFAIFSSLFFAGVLILVLVGNFRQKRKQL